MSNNNTNNKIKKQKYKKSNNNNQQSISSNNTNTNTNTNNADNSPNSIKNSNNNKRGIYQGGKALAQQRYQLYLAETHSKSNNGTQEQWLYLHSQLELAIKQSLYENLYICLYEGLRNHYVQLSQTIAPLITQYTQTNSSSIDSVQFIFKVITTGPRWIDKALNTSKNYGSNISSSSSNSTSNSTSLNNTATNESNQSGFPDFQKVFKTITSHQLSGIQVLLATQIPNLLVDSPSLVNERIKSLAISYESYYSPSCFSRLITSLQLTSLSPEYLVQYANSLVKQGFLREAAQFITSLQLQKYFELDTIVFPCLQQQFYDVVLSYVDNRKEYYHPIITALTNKPFDKPSQAYKYIKQWKLNETDFPDTIFAIKRKSLNWVISSGNSEELAELLCDDNKELQEYAINQLITKDLQTAAKLAVKYGLDSLPNYYQIVRTAAQNKQFYEQEKQAKLREITSKTLQLPENFPVYMLDSSMAINKAKIALSSKKPDIIGLDGEALFTATGNIPALLQISTRTEAYLIDLLNYTEEVDDFAFELFSNVSLKLGYSFGSDLTGIRSEFRNNNKPYKAFQPEFFRNLLDLQEIEKVYENFQSAQSENKTDISNTVSNSSNNGDINNNNNNNNKKKPEIRGLSRLCEKYLAKPLDKSQQMSNWSRRPLNDAQIKYSSLDALCLIQLYDYYSQNWNPKLPELSKIKIKQITNNENKEIEITATSSTNNMQD